MFHEFFESFPAKGRREADGITSVWDLERSSAAVIPYEHGRSWRSAAEPA